jgi:hypothetical protein
VIPPARGRVPDRSSTRPGERKRALDGLLDDLEAYRHKQRAEALCDAICKNALAKFQEKEREPL